jgi:hypothetical protein
VCAVIGVMGVTRVPPCSLRLTARLRPMKVWWNAAVIASVCCKRGFACVCVPLFLLLQRELACICVHFNLDQLVYASTIVYKIHWQLCRFKCILAFTQAQCVTFW